MNWDKLNITIDGLRQHYHDGDFSPRELIAYLSQKCAQFDDKNIWLYQLNENELAPYLTKLDQENAPALPLYGIPFAIKDNIDLANIPTTAGCMAFSYTPTQHAFVVELLINAGAIPLGKTNMDQFATGLVGTRTTAPWQPCKNAFHDEYIAGGSSSGSAVAVALGLASFSLGTDTAGSGRIPAAFNNLVGLKPTRGVLSNSGVVPACKSLDVISIFALTADDANSVFDITSQYDPKDDYARPNPYLNTHRAKGLGSGTLRIGMPKAAHLEFFDDEQTQNEFYQSVEQWRQLGAEIIEVDYDCFAAAAKLLYEGPWVSERYIAMQAALEHYAEAMHPVVRKIAEGGKDLTAVAAFEAQYRLQHYKKQCDQILNQIDFLITPTAATRFTIQKLLDNPVTLNSQLGYYTNYMNLLDYTAIALPYRAIQAAVPNGFTLVSQKFSDQKLLAYAKLWQRHATNTLGATSLHYRAAQEKPFSGNLMIQLVVCGAHLEGFALNWQLIERDAKLLSKTRSAEKYRLYALADGKRPGMVRDEKNGAAIAVEVWEIPSENLGSFVAAIPAPLGIGKVELADGSWHCGFICDAYGLDAAKDITEFGGWQHYLALKP